MKKLIPAICMTLIAAFMLASSTFAWFSMNTTVTANGMTVTAKSESKFLQIVNSTTTFKDNEAQASATATNGTKAVRPTAAVKTIADDALTNLSASDDASDIKWAEAFSKNPADSTKGTAYKDVSTAATATDSSNVYTLINDFKVRLNPKTGATEATNLRVKSVTIKSDVEPANNALLEAVRVLIVCDTEWALYGSSGKIVASDDTGSVLAAQVTTAETPIKVYIFFDGEHTATTTNNATTLSTNGYKVEFELTID